MSIKTDELRTERVDSLVTPAQLADDYPLDDQVAAMVLQARTCIENILSGQDPRLLVIVGPCSIHDPKAALDYANRLHA
ncbi:MAG: 3-deoxy-7-phosphoheptulonate synthase, partial [Plesiomonas shigelloides]